MGSCCSGSKKKKKKDHRRDREDENDDESMSTDSQEDKFDCVIPPDEIDIEENREEDVKNEKVTKVKTKVIDQAQGKQIHKSTETKVESSSNEHPAATPLNQAQLQSTSATSDYVSQEEQKIKSSLQSLHHSPPSANTRCDQPKPDKEAVTDEKKANVLEIPKHIASAAPVLPAPTRSKRAELSPAPKATSTLDDKADREMTTGEKEANVIEVPKPIASPAPVLLPTPTGFKRTELESHAPKVTVISNDNKERKSDKEVITGDKKVNVLETSKPKATLPVPSALPKTSTSSSHETNKDNGDAKPKPKASPAPVLLPTPTGFKLTEQKNPAPSTLNYDKEVTIGDKKAILEMSTAAPVLPAPTGFNRTQLKSPAPKVTITLDDKADREIAAGGKEANQHEVSKPISSDLPVPSVPQGFLPPKTNLSSSHETSETINGDAKPLLKTNPAPALLPTPTGFKRTEIKSIVPMIETSNDEKVDKPDNEVITGDKKVDALETSNPKATLPVPSAPPKTNISSSHETNEVNDGSKENASEIKTDKTVLSDTKVGKSINKSIPEPSPSTPTPTGPPISLATSRPKSAGIKTSSSKPKSLPRPRSILPTRGMQIHKSPAPTNALKCLIEKSKIVINAPKSAGPRSTLTAPPTLLPESKFKSIEQKSPIPNVSINDRTDKLVIETNVVDGPGAKKNDTKMDESNKTVEVTVEDKVKSPEQKETDVCASKLAPKLPSPAKSKSPMPKSNVSELPSPGQQIFLPTPNRSKLFIPIKAKCPISNANALSELDKNEENGDEKSQEDTKKSSSPLHVLLPASDTSNVASKSKAAGALPHLSMLPSSFSVTNPSPKSSTASQSLPLPTKVNKPTPTGLPVPLRPPTFLPKSSKTQNALSDPQSAKPIDQTAVNDENKTGTLPMPIRAPVLLPATAGPKSSLPLPASTGLPRPPMVLPSGSGGSKSGSKASELPQPKESSGESVPAQNDDVVVKDHNPKSKKGQKKPSSKSSTKSSSKKKKATKPSSKSSTKSKKSKSSKTQRKKPSSKSSVKSHKADKNALTTKKPNSKSSEHKSKVKSKSASSNGSQKTKPRSKPTETTEQKSASSSNNGGNQSDKMH